MQIHRRHRNGSRLGERRGPAQERPHRLFAQRLPLVKQLGQRLFNLGFAFFAGQVQELHVFLVGTSGLLLHQGVVRPTIVQRRIHIVAVDVAGKRSGLPHQPADDVPVVDPMLVLAT